MRWWALLCAIAFALGAAAQDKPAPRKKAVQKRQQQAAHAKPTPEQIRKFNDLQKKQKQ